MGQKCLSVIITQAFCSVCHIECTSKHKDIFFFNSFIPSSKSTLQYFTFLRAALISQLAGYGDFQACLKYLLARRNVKKYIKVFLYTKVSLLVRPVISTRGGLVISTRLQGLFIGTNVQSQASLWGQRSGLGPASLSVQCTAPNQHETILATKLFSSLIHNFKLGHFIAKAIFPNVTNTQT